VHTRKAQNLASAALAFDGKPVAWQRLATDNLAQFEGEAPERGEARRFGMQVPEIEPPAAALLAAVLADDSVQPALQAAGEVEIRAVDGEDERVIEHRAIEPVRHDEIDAVGPPARIGALGPLIDPGEAMHATLADLT